MQIELPLSENQNIRLNENSVAETVQNSEKFNDMDVTQTDPNIANIWNEDQVSTHNHLEVLMKSFNLEEYLPNLMGKCMSYI